MELQPDPRDVARFGLAVSKQTPNILDENKVNQFFCSTAFSYPEDYQTRAIFGDYPYRFNISLTEEGENQIRSVGDVIPDEYGYIRRDVKIKSSSNATIDNTMIREFGYNNTENVSFNQFSIQINNTELLQGEITNPAYQINPMTQRIMINITDLENQGLVSTTGPGYSTRHQSLINKFLPDLPGRDISLHVAAGFKVHEFYL